MTAPELEALLHAIERLAPNDDRAVPGIMLASIQRVELPGVELHVDWPQFLRCTPAELDQVFRARLEQIEARDRRRHESALSGQRVKAGLARRKAEGKPVGRPPGAKDKRQRKRSGYFARWELERIRRRLLG